MAIRFTSTLSWQVTLMIGIGTVVGASIGVSVVTYLALPKLNAMAQEGARKDTRIELLESILLQRTDEDVIALSDNPNAAAPDQPPATVAKSAPPGGKAQAASPAPPSGQPGPPSAPAIAKAPRPAPSASPAPSPSPAAARNPAPAPAVTSTPAPPPATAAVAAIERPTPEGVGATETGAAPAPQFKHVTGEELIIAMRNPKTEGVPAEKAGVRGLARNKVFLKNGSTIVPGGFFPSGERLILVDHENGRVVTNQRQLLLFFSRPQGGQVNEQPPP